MFKKVEDEVNVERFVSTKELRKQKEFLRKNRKRKN